MENMTTSRRVGTIARGVRCPIIREGDNLAQIVVDSVLLAAQDECFDIRERDVIGITESVVARAQGNYCTIDEVAEDLKVLYKNHDEIALVAPIFSRNRFSIILRGISRAFKKVYVVSDVVDEVGNVMVHPITKVNYNEFYKGIVEAEGAAFEWTKDCPEGVDILDCHLHLDMAYSKDDAVLGKNVIRYTLCDVLKAKCPFGLLGSNKASEDVLKLFPKDATELVYSIQAQIKEKTGKTVEVMLYGDGGFKDPGSGIWEFADPVVSPSYTRGLEGTPNEVKIKFLADSKYAALNGKELDDAIREEIVKKESDLAGKMITEGTTPRKITDLLGSLMDLTTGSGDKGTPIVLVQGYFDNYTDTY